MQVTVEIPDEVAQRLTRNGEDPSRTALEAVSDAIRKHFLDRNP